MDWHITSGGSADVYCTAWRAKQPPYVTRDIGAPMQGHQFPTPYFDKAAAIEQNGSGKPLPDNMLPPRFSSAVDLGRTKTKYKNNVNPVWNWRMSQICRVPTSGKRGWLVIQVLDEDKFTDDVIGQVAIDLDQVQVDTASEGWYSVVGTTNGMIKVRILLSSGPPISAAATILHAGSLQLCSRDSSWLLADYDIVSIYAKVHQLDEEIAATGTKAAAPGDTKWTLNGERIHTDRSHSRVRVADQARLLWRATELLDKAWDIFDINENGQISAKELHALMGALGEKLSAEEIAWMIVECKAWGRRSFPEFRTLLAQHQLEHILPGGGVAHSADQPVIHQQMEFLRLMVEDMELPTCTCPVEHAESEQLCLNVLDERMVITRDEFQIMMSEYWTCRKHTAHSSEMRRGLDRRPPWEEDITDDYTLMKPQVDQWHQAMLNTFHFKNVDHLLDASVNPTNHFLGRQPQWLAGLANDHQLDAVAPRTAHALWFFVRCRVEHILIKKTRAQLKPGAQTKRLKLLDPEALVKQNAPEEKPGADLRDLTRRTVGSPDGKIEASKFSTVWDLLQVFFLLYVLVSVPFAIAFDFQWEVGVPMWWFELVVDTYFVLDLLMYFRTPYFVDGVIHDGTCQMAKNYLCGWFIPDVLSCVSILEYFLDRGLSNMRAARLVRLIKLTKLLKLARLQRLRERQRVLFQEIFDGDMLRKLGAVGSAVKLLLGFCLAVHLVSCTWYFIGAMNSDGWVVDNGWDLPDDVNITGSNSTRPALFRRYMISMTSIMILDPPADSATAEQVFAIFNVLINSFIFGSVAATFTSIIAKLAEPFRVFNSKMAMLRTWMGTKRFTHSTRQTIEMFYAAKLGSANGTVVNETEIMSAFRAAPIEKEVVALMYAKQIKQLPMFQSLTEDLISKLCLQLTQLPALQGMPVVVQGQLAECMYIVNEGRLQNWQTTSNGVLRARCTMHQSSFLPLTSLPDATFWAEAWDSSSWDSSSHNDSIDAIRGQLTLLDVSELKRQCQADGVSDEAWNNAMDRPGISARQGMIDAICEHVAGGTINMNGQESNPALRHRAIIGNISYSATSRHASFDQYPLTVPFRRNFFFKDFDPLEGYSNVRVRAGDSMQVIEVRRGNVLSYLTPGDYFGEVCLLGADNDTSVYYGSNLTAMVDSQICFLNKSDVLKLKEQYPEIERSMEVAVNQRNAALRPRQLFAQAAGADGTVGRNEVRQLLQDLGCHRVEIDTALRSLTGPTLNEQNFESWYRCYEAQLRSRCRAALQAMSLGQLVQWMKAAEANPKRIVEALDMESPFEALIDTYLSNPELVLFWQKYGANLGSEGDEQDIPLLVAKNKLDRMTLGALLMRASEMEIPEQKIGHALDKGDPRLAMRELILTQLVARTRSIDTLLHSNSLSV